MKTQGVLKSIYKKSFKYNQKQDKISTKSNKLTTRLKA